MTQNEAYLRSYYRGGYTSPFGDCRPVGSNPCGRRHRGSDSSHSSQSGTIAVPAAYSGTVVGFTRPNDGSGFGHGIKVRSLLGDGNYWILHYAHGPWASSQKQGEWIEQGQIILHEGLSGFTSGPCVHIEQMREKDGFFTDPRPELLRVARGQKDYGAAAPAPAPAPAPAGGGEAKPEPLSVFKSLNWRGIAAMLRGTGRYTGNNTPGPVMFKAFQDFLNDAGYGQGLKLDGDPRDATAKATQRWLKGTKRYSGDIDGWLGKGTVDGWNKAENENWNAFQRFQQWP